MWISLVILLQLLSLLPLLLACNTLAKFEHLMSLYSRGAADILLRSWTLVVDATP